MRLCRLYVKRAAASLAMLQSYITIRHKVSTMPADFPNPKRLSQSLHELIGASRVPGLIVGAAHADQPAAVFAYGKDANGTALTADSLIPVASVTKLATALSVLRLADSGELGLQDELHAHLPEAAAARSTITMTQLLCHTSGLPMDVDPKLVPYNADLDSPTLDQACLQTYPETTPEQQVQYSNVGYGLLALIVEAHTGLAFPEALKQLVLDPLHMSAWLGDESHTEPAVVDDVRSSHANTEIEPFNSRHWRSLAMPWAGLVTNANGALALVRAFLGYPADFLNETTRKIATQSHTAQLTGGFVKPMWWQPCPWGLGPEIRGNKAPHWVPEDMPASFGHSGASGCLAWADPVSQQAWVILGTRTAASGWLLRRGPALSRVILEAVTSDK